MAKRWRGNGEDLVFYCANLLFGFRPVNNVIVLARHLWLATLTNTPRRADRRFVIDDDTVHAFLID